MRTLAARIKRAEEAAGAIRRPPQFQWLEAGAPVPDDGDGVMYVSWSAEGPEFPLPREPREPAADVDEQITAILSELRAEGLSDEQIEAALEESVPKNGNAELAAPAVSDERAWGISDRETSEKQADAGPQPNRAEELVSMFRRR
jgi:hypothetical protein